MGTDLDWLLDYAHEYGGVVTWRRVGHTPGKALSVSNDQQRWCVEIRFGDQYRTGIGRTVEHAAGGIRGAILERLQRAVA